MKVAMTKGRGIYCNVTLDLLVLFFCACPFPLHTATITLLTPSHLRNSRRCNPSLWSRPKHKPCCTTVAYFYCFLNLYHIRLSLKTITLRFLLHHCRIKPAFIRRDPNRRTAKSVERTHLPHMSRTQWYSGESCCYGNRWKVQQSKGTSRSWIMFLIHIMSDMKQSQLPRAPHQDFIPPALVQFAQHCYKKTITNPQCSDQGKQRVI